MEVEAPPGRGDDLKAKRGEVGVGGDADALDAAAPDLTT